MAKRLRTGTKPCLEHESDESVYFVLKGIRELVNLVFVYSGPIGKVLYYKGFIKGPLKDHSYFNLKNQPLVQDENNQFYLRGSPQEINDEKKRNLFKWMPYCTNDGRLPSGFDYNKDPDDDYRYRELWTHDARFRLCVKPEVGKYCVRQESTMSEKTNDFLDVKAEWRPLSDGSSFFTEFGSTLTIDNNGNVSMFHLSSKRLHLLGGTKDEWFAIDLTDEDPNLPFMDPTLRLVRIHPHRVGMPTFRLPTYSFFPSVEDRYSFFTFWEWENRLDESIRVEDLAHLGGCEQAHIRIIESTLYLVHANRMFIDVFELVLARDRF